VTVAIFKHEIPLRTMILHLLDKVILLYS